MISGRLLKNMAGRAAGALILAAFIGAAFVVTGTAPTAAPAEPQERVWPVSVMEARPASLSPLLSVYGRLESEQVTALRSRIAATVEEVAVAEGDWVEAGDVLVRLEREDAELALESARAGRDRAAAAVESMGVEFRLAEQLVTHHRELDAIARSRLARFEKLHRDRMISDAQLDDMRQQAGERAMVLAQHMASVEDVPNRIALRQAELREAQARLAQAERDLEHTVLRAPFSGRILRAAVAVGDRISSGENLLEVADYHRLQIRASVPAEAAAQLREQLAAGDIVRAVASIGNRQKSFSLTQLSATVKTGQSGVDALFASEADPDLLIGDLVNLEITLPARDDVLALPLHALYEGDRIYRIESGRLQSVDVERVGDYRNANGEYRVLVRTPAVTGGDQLMTTQLPVAVSGLLVNPVNAEPDAGRYTPIALSR